MRIIGGSARGTKLYTLAGENTRPTLDRVREALFNIIQNEIKNAKFLDLFSGSGAVGLEALSRGAKSAILCDNSKDAIDIIKRNTEKTHFEEKAKIYNMNFKNLLNKIDEVQDIIYLDPPYKSEYAIDAIKIIIEKNIANSNSIIIVETDQKDDFLKKIENIKIDIYDTRKYGRAYLIFLKKM